MSKKKRKTRIRYDRIFILLVIFVGIIGIIIYIFPKDKKEVKLNKEEKKNYIELILKKENVDIDEKFLNWVVSNYGDKVLEPLYTSLENKKYDQKLWHELTGDSYLVLQDKYQNKYANNPDIKVIEGKKDSVTISFAGDISLADNWEVMPYYKSRKKGVYGILSEEIVKYMNDTDLMIINSEFSFSNRGTPTPNKTYTFRANPDNVSIYKEMGVDLVTLANNHVYDFGESAFLDTLTTLDNAGIPRIGAGKNLAEAKKAYYFVMNGYKIAFINACRAEKYRLTPGATDTSSGIFLAYDPALFAEEIKKAKENSDYVIALIHWGTEDSHELQEVQKETGKLYIDSGADMVVGTHAHALQGVEFYKDKLIAYNLGDFIFSHGRQDTGILSWVLNFDGSSQYLFVPALQDDYKTSILHDKEALDLYQKMTRWSINGKFLEDGEIVKET